MRIFVVTVLILFGMSCTKNDCCNIPDADIDLKSIEFAELQNSIHQFSTDLLKNLVGVESADSNLMISPLSIQIALYMTYNGSNGDTRKAMANVLGWDEIDPKSLNLVYKDLISRLSPKNNSVQLQIANAVFWDKNRITPYDEFRLAMDDSYHAKMLEEDFLNNPKETLDKINNWVDKSTNGKIDKILEELDPTEIMFLVNALYFIGSWDLPFDENQTRVDFFNKLDGKPVEVNFMTQDNYLLAYLGEDYRAVESQFSDSDYAMYFILPPENEFIDQFILEFNFHNFYKELDNLFHEQRIDLWLPKFQIDYKIKLNDALKVLGMEIAFDKLRADFSKLGEVAYGNPFISRVEHKTFLKIDEKGAEGAAVTAVGIAIESAPTRLKFDRPYMTLLLHKETKTPLFIGKIVNPTQD